MTSRHRCSVIVISSMLLGDNWFLPIEKVSNSSWSLCKLVVCAHCLDCRLSSVIPGVTLMVFLRRLELKQVTE